MQIAIHQPEFFPWLGFFYKMSQVDKYLVLDHVQFKKRYFENRNKIVSPDGTVSWMTVPVKTKNRFAQAINRVEIDNDTNWRSKFLGKIRYYYGKSEFFQSYYAKIEQIVDTKASGLLIELNLAFIQLVRAALGINTDLLFSSQIIGENWQHTGSDLILNLCIECNADRYYCGQSGKNYLRLEDFEKAGIAIEWMDFLHPVYPQQCEEFVPFMSALDFLFNNDPGNWIELLNSKGKQSLCTY